jgi:hypothetical protein
MSDGIAQPGRVASCNLQTFNYPCDTRSKALSINIKLMIILIQLFLVLATVTSFPIT